MLQQIDIINFQSHTNTRLSLVPGVNVIVGASDQGKTAVLRAIEWLRTNRPLGSSIIYRLPDGRQEASVCVGIQVDGHVIQHCRGSMAPDYVLDGQEFNCVNKQVPEPIQTLLWQDINVQGQLDSHFMILDPSSQAARAINEATGLHEVDAIIKVLAGRLRQDSTRRKFLVGESAHVQEQLDHPVYARLEDYRKLLNRLDSLEQRHAKLNEDERNLGAIIRTVLVLQDQLDRIKVLSQKQRMRLNSLREDAKELLSRHERLNRDYGTISGLYGDIENGEEVLYVLRGPDKELVGTVISKCSELNEKRRRLVESRNSLSSAIGYVVLVQKDLASCEKSMAAEQDELIDSVGSLISEEQLCPVCLTRLQNHQQIETTVVNMCRLFGV